jgi:outer membrane protein OmpA-like peptidoglycan-associated protein
MKLSRDRAESVKNYLISQGVSTEKLKSVGFGEGRPITENQTPEGRANNRRVEIIISRPTRGASPTST